MVRNSAVKPMKYRYFLTFPSFRLRIRGSAANQQVALMAFLRDENRLTRFILVHVTVITSRSYEYLWGHSKSMSTA